MCIRDRYADDCIIMVGSEMSANRVMRNISRFIEKKLGLKVNTVSYTHLTDDNIKAFERVARKYNVDFAVKRDKTTEPPKYLVFFKGKDCLLYTSQWQHADGYVCSTLVRSASPRNQRLR